MKKPSGTCKSETVRLWIAGSASRAEEALGEWCRLNGACFSITPCTYVYSGGQEEGVEVGLINYPRFPKNRSEMLQRMRQVGELLCVRLNQRSYTIDDGHTTEWYSETLAFEDHK